MKNYLFFFFLALITPRMISCKGHKNGPDENPETKQTIVLTVDSVGQNFVVFSVNPSDTLAPYYIDAKPRSMVVDLTTEELIKNFKAGMDVVIAMAADQGLQYSYADVFVAQKYYKDAAARM